MNIKYLGRIVSMRKSVGFAFLPIIADQIQIHRPAKDNYMERMEKNEKLSE